tara:strand:+ start:215 stop:757 length:543 start_codon:yes stop_codon:yes gene_type:complete
MFRFTPAQLSAATETRVAPESDTEAELLLKGLLGASHVSAGALQYEDPGGCHISFRTAVVKLCGMKLFGIGLASALVAAAGLDTISTRSCALSAAINLVASYFYYLLWNVRRQGWVGGPFELAMLRPRHEEKKPNPRTLRQRVFVQETAADGIRQMDWTITVRHTDAHSKSNHCCAATHS